MDTIKNKFAYSRYEILKEFEAGIKLKGYEVKAIKEGKAKLLGSFVKIKDNSAYLHGFDIQKYSKSSNIVDFDPNRPKLLLLNADEIKYIKRELNQKGISVVALKVYTKKRILKVNIGLAKGKKKHELKQDLKEKDLDRDLEQEIKLQSGFKRV